MKTNRSELCSGKNNQKPKKHIQERVLLNQEKFKMRFVVLSAWEVNLTKIPGWFGGIKAGLYNGRVSRNNAEKMA